MGAQAAGPQVLTANRLLRGDVVYWNGRHGWVGRLEEAEVLWGEEAEAALRAAEQGVRDREIVAPYLFEVRVENGMPTPLRIREAIRAKGPSVRPDLAKAMP